MRNHITAAVVGGIAGGLVVALAFLVLGNGPRSAWNPTPAKAAALNDSGGPTREDMRRMMDAVQGEGTCQRMHEAMGQDAEKMMDQCGAMMTKEMMDQCAAMMPGTGTGMMSGQNGDSMRDMMRRMMPQSGL